jgi:hypothetical protein
MDDHRRKMWAAILGQLGEYCAGRLDLGALTEGLRGLYVEADRMILPSEAHRGGPAVDPWHTLEPRFVR